MLPRREFLLGTVAGSIGAMAQAAEPQIRDSRTIALLPKTTGELKSLHDRSRDYSAELIPEEQSLDVKGFTPYLTKRDEVEAQKKLPNTSCRRHALSVGLEMMREDQEKLPKLSGGQILAYLKTHFVSIQARIYREPVSRALYLGGRCLAATRTFRGSAFTKPFSPTVADSVSNIRSLGLLVPGRTPQTPSNLRTLVLVHKNQLATEEKRSSEGKINYEYLFIRGREAGPDRLELYAFATSDERTKFHWLKPAESPESPSDCSVRGAVHFTEYSHQGLYPKTSVVRRSLITGKKSFAWESIERYTREKFSSPAMDCITQLLDAIIAGDVPESDFRPPLFGPRTTISKARTP